MVSLLQHTRVNILQIILLHVSSMLIEEDNGTPLQYSCLEKPMDGGAW